MPTMSRRRPGPTRSGTVAPRYDSNVARVNLTPGRYVLASSGDGRPDTMPATMRARRRPPAPVPAPQQMSTAPPTPPPFLRPRPAPLRGREDLVDELVDVARRAAGGRGSARTLVGEPGVGKTAVIDEVVRRLVASPIGFDIVRLKGLEAEVEMAWSGLAGLLDSHIDR